MSALLPYLKLLCEGARLSCEQAAAVMDMLLDAEYPPEQAAMLLGAMRARSETVEELTGFATSLRRRSLRPPVQREDLVDTCGTGGDGAGTFNISTAAALVSAAAGVTVAKHGNRAASSRCGSADVLEALGVGIEIEPSRAAAAIDGLGFGFLYAPYYHPALRRLAAVRRAVGVRTPLNLLGPLVNPARVHRQLLGVCDLHTARTLAQVLRELEVKEALVVAGSDGLDELTLSGATHAVHLRAGVLHELTLYPEDAGLDRSPAAALKGGDARENAQLIEQLLSGELKGPRRDVVVYNAAAVLFVSGRSKDLTEGAALAGEVLRSGSALRLLEQLREVHR